MRMRFRKVLVAACLLLLAGCETMKVLNPFNTGKVDADAPTALADIDAEVTFKSLWDVQIGDGLGRQYLLLAPAVGGGRVYAADGYGLVEAREVVKGRRIWQTRIGEPDGQGLVASMRFWERADHAFVTGGVGAGDGIVMIGTANGEVIALDDLDGHEIWRTTVSSEVLSPPYTDGDVVVLETLDGHLIALDRESGVQRWRNDTQVPVLSLRGTSSPAIADGVVVAGFANGHVAAFRSSSGEPVWEQRVTVPQGRSELDRMVDIDGAPLIEGANVYVGTYQGRVRAMRMSDGTATWEKEASTHQRLASGLGQVYVVGKNDVLQALDTNGGSVLWESEALRLRQLTSPVVIDNYVVVGDMDGYVHAFTQSDGRLVGRQHIDSDGLRSDFVVADGVLYGLSNGGRLFALTLER